MDTITLLRRTAFLLKETQEDLAALSTAFEKLTVYLLSEQMKSSKHTKQR